MKNKLGYLVLVIAFLSVLIVPSVLAATSIIAPAASATSICLNTLVNVSADGHGTNNFTCVLYAKSASTANSSWSIISSGFANTTEDNAVVNLNITGLEDSNDYIFNATCRNDSSPIGEDTNTGITIACTTPTAPSSLTPTSDDDGTVDFSSTVTGSTTTGCTLNFVSTNPGSTSYTMTHSGDTCTYSSLLMPEQSYQYYVEASDGTDTATSSVQTVEVDIEDNSNPTAVIQQIEEQQAEAEQESKQNTIIGIIVVIVLIVVIFIIASRWKKYK